MRDRDGKTFVAKWQVTVAATVRVGDGFYRVRLEDNELSVEPANAALLAELQHALDRHISSHGDPLCQAFDGGGFDYGDLERVTVRQRVPVGSVFTSCEGAIVHPDGSISDAEFHAEILGEAEPQGAEIVRTLREGKIIASEPTPQKGKNIKRSREAKRTTPMFFTPTSARGSFVVHFTCSPLEDFGIWARGYAAAARRLSASLLSKQALRDSDAYPVAFLYRHALELYLKGVISAASQFVSLRDSSTFAQELRAKHQLIPLYDTASKLLRKSFPTDPGLPDFLKKLRVVVTDLNAIDSDSFCFRYPVDTDFKKPSVGSFSVGLIQLAQGMDEVLDAFDSIETAILVETDDVGEALAHLYQDAHEEEEHYDDYEGDEVHENDEQQ